jgi:hypothetical protein
MPLFLDIMMLVINEEMPSRESINTKKGDFERHHEKVMATLSDTFRVEVDAY